MSLNAHAPRALIASTLTLLGLAGLAQLLPVPTAGNAGLQDRTSDPLPGPSSGRTSTLESYQAFRFGPEDGLPARGVDALEFDATGRLWVGTSGGLAVFDGLHFQPIRSQQTPGLDSDRISSIARGMDGSMWIGTIGGPVSGYRNGRFTEISAHDSPRDVRQILFEEDGTAWLLGNRLGRCDQGQVTNYHPEQAGNDLFLRRMALSAEGTLWVATEKGLLVVQEGRLVPRHSRSTSWVLTDFDGNVWARDAASGHVLAAGQIEPTTNSITVPFADLTDETQVSPTQRIISTSEGLWTVTPAQRRGAPPVFERIHSTDDGWIGCVAASTDGGIWLGTRRDGLHFLQQSVSVPVLLEETGATREPSIGDVIDLGDDRLIARTTLGDRSWLVRADGACAPIRKSAGWLAGVSGACLDERGRIVIATHGGMFTIEEDVAVPVPGFDSPVEALFKDTNGVIWYSTGHTVTEFVPAGNRPPRTIGPFRSKVTRLLPTHGGMLSVHGNVIERGDVESYRVTTLHEFPHAIVRGVHQDSHGHHWVATYGDGLYRLRGSEVDHWDLDDGLPDAFLGWIGEPGDDTGGEFLWANSNSGPLRLEIATLDQRASGSKEPIRCTVHANPEGNGPGGSALSDGQLAFPTVEGLYFINTTVDLKRQRAPTVFVNSVETNGQPFAPTHALFGSATLQFRYGALVYPSATDAVYRYQLVGYDDDWIDNGHERTVRFTDLPPGDFRFKVQARAGDSPWSPAVECAAITIHRDWFQRWDFRALLLVALLGLLRLLYAWRTEAIRTKSVQLEQEIEHRRTLSRALQASARNHQTTLETAIDGIVTCKTDGTICYVNPALERMLDLERSTVHGRPIATLGIEEMEHTIAQFANSDAMGQGRKARTLRSGARSRGGKLLDVEVTIGRAGSSNAQRLVCVVRDIGERKQMVDAIAQSERRFRGLFQTAPSANFVWRRDLSVAEWNDCAGQLFGWDDRPPCEEDLLDRVVPQPHHPMLHSALHSAFEGHTAENFLCPTLTALGQTRSCRWYLSPTKDTNGEVQTVLVLVIDVTDEERMSRSLERLRRRIVKAEETERSRIARELHDDLSQRLAALAMDAQMIAQASVKDGSSPPGAASEATAQRLQEGLASLAVDVHSLSRRLHPAVVDDLGLARALRSECSLRSAQGDAAVRFLDHSAGHSAAPEVALALFRIAQESIRNAQRHGHASEIKVELDCDGEMLTLDVIDNGKGFEINRSADSSNEQRDGGLGLVSMQERVKLVGGSLEIASKLGEGTRIHAIAPRTPGPDHEPDGDATIGVAVHESRRGSGVPRRAPSGD